MDERSSAAVLDRLTRVEGQIADLVLDQEAMRIALDALYAQAARAAEHAPPPRVRGAADSVSCPTCLGGNPAQAQRCMWCGNALPLRTVHEAPAAISTPATAPETADTLLPSAMPAATIAPALAAAPPAERALTLPIATQADVEKWPDLVTTDTGVTGVPAPELESAPAMLPGADQEARAPETTAPAPNPLHGLLNFDILGKSEFWLNKVGIGLLLLGLAFFFKYSIDRGWLNEPVRIGAGLLLGTVLLGAGLRWHTTRPQFSQVLLGGSIATYYITGYAAYEMFHLVDYGVAFGFMALTTALAFALAVRQDRVILSGIGVAGGLLTPFVLTTTATGATGLVTYTCLVLAGASGIYLFRGWRSLLWLAYAGGWAVLVLGWLGTVVAGQAIEADRWALQAGALFVLLAFWGVPVLREVLAPKPSAPIEQHAHLLAISAPLLVLGFSRLVWESTVPDAVFGWAVGLGAVAYAGVAWALRQRLPRLAYTHYLMAILLFTLGLVQVLQGNALLFALAGEATVLHFVTRRFADQGPAVYGHAISAGVAGWLFWNLSQTLFDRPGLTATTLTNLAVIGLLAVASFGVRPAWSAVFYRNAVHLAVVGWLLQQLYIQANWPAWVMGAWAVYALALTTVYRGWPEQFTIAESAGPAAGIFGAAAVLFAARITTGQIGDLAVFNQKTLIDLGFVAVIAAASLLVPGRVWMSGYRIMAHAGVLALLWRELSGLQRGDGYVMLAWLAYLAGVQYLCRRTDDPRTAWAAHLPALAAVVALLLRMVLVPPHAPVLVNLDALINLGVIGLILANAYLIRPIGQRSVYAWGAHGAILVWFWHELYQLPNGVSYLMLAWAAYGLLVQYLATPVPAQAPQISAAAIVPWAGAAACLAANLTGPTWEVPVFNPPAVAGLVTIGLALAAGYLAPQRELTRLYWGVCYAAGLGWLWHEFYSLVPNGSGYVILSWAVYATVLHVLAGRMIRPVEARAGTGLAHLTFTLAGAWLALRLVSDAVGQPLWNPGAVTDLVTLGLIAGVAWRMAPSRAGWVYLLAAHAGLLAWFWRELTPLASGPAFVSVAWGVYAVALLVAGLRGTRTLPLVYAGISTLLLIVAKLFLIDLVAVDPLWRVLLFLGFGGAFLGLSYVLQNAIRGTSGFTLPTLFHRPHTPHRPAH